MRWRRTSNVGIEDRRGQRFGPGAAVGGLGGVGALIFIVLQLLGGGNFDPGGLDGFPVAPEQQDNFENAPDPDKDLKDFMGFVLQDVQATWKETFAEAGRPYRSVDLVLFDRATQTGCGVGSSETGPFYCPVDEKMYLDLSFFRELRDRFGAPGDFAQAYVIAHEMGHHVQKLLGIEQDVRNEQQSNPESERDLSIAMELQADCFAGIWGHAAFDKNLLESGDLEEGLDAAASIGDDRIQRQTTGRVNPETWTHGSSAQRADWFRRGFDTGAVDDCDTFS